MAFYRALAVLVGTIIGIGIFGLPQVFLKSGIILAIFYLFLLSLVILLNHLFFGEIILRTKENHRFIGYLKKYLGKPFALIEFGSLIFSILGSLLAYIIIAGEFLNNIFGSILDFSSYSWSILFWLIFSFFILKGIKLVSRGELFLNIFLILIIFFIFLVSISHIKFLNFAHALTIKNFKNFFFPYGVILFSLSGVTAIPEIRQILKNQENKLKKVIVLGTLIVPILYLIFVFSVIGVSGGNITEDIFSGLQIYLGRSIMILGSIFGFLAVTTSFIVLGLYFKDTLLYDFNINKFFSSLIVLFVPILLFLISSWGFIKIIGFVGAIFGGIDGILMVLLYRKVKKLKGDRKPEYSLNISSISFAILILLFLFGIIYQIIYSI